MLVVFLTSVNSLETDKNLLYDLLLTFGFYLLHYMYSQSYCRLYMSGCCYSLRIFCEVSVCVCSCSFCMLFSVHWVTSTTVLTQMTERLCRSIIMTKDVCKCMPLTVTTTHTTHNTVSVLAMAEKTHAALAAGPQAENTTTNIQTLGQAFKKKL